MKSINKSNCSSTIKNIRRIRHGISLKSRNDPLRRSNYSSVECEIDDVLMKSYVESLRYNGENLRYVKRVYLQG